MQSQGDDQPVFYCPPHILSYPSVQLASPHFIRSVGCCFTSLTFVPSSMTQEQQEQGCTSRQDKRVAEGDGSHQRCPNSKGTVPPHLNSVGRTRGQ